MVLVGGLVPSILALGDNPGLGGTLGNGGYKSVIPELGLVFVNDAVQVLGGSDMPDLILMDIRLAGKMNGRGKYPAL